MDPRSPSVPRSPNPNDFWELTDKKHPNSFLFRSEGPKKPIDESAKYAAANAAGASIATLPVISYTGIEIMRSGRGGFIDVRILGVPVLVGGIVLDTIKAPICLAVAAEEGIRAGILKMTSLLFERNPEKDEVERIMKSLMIRMHETALVLVALGLAGEDVLKKRLASGDIADFLGLTLLHTAFASRNNESLVLASNKLLSRENCPVFGRALFDKIVAIRKLINDALQKVNPNLWQLRTEERQLAESRIVCDWIQAIYIGKDLTPTERPGATQAQLDVINKLIHEINEMKELAMQTLPVEAKEIGRQMRM